MSTPTPPRRWRDIDEVAEHLNCSAQTVRRMVKRGELPAHRVGYKLVRFDLNEIDAAITGQNV